MLETRKEEIFFFLDIATDFLKKKAILKSLKDYIEKKKKINILSSFNSLIFNEDNAPVFKSNKTSAKDIVDPLSNAWSIRKRQSHLENGLFFILSEILQKAKRVVANYRIIAITDSPSEIPLEMQQALFDLLEKVKILPTFVDIVRVGAAKFYADDVKLKIITSDTGGGMFYAESADYLAGVLDTLTKDKQTQNVLTSAEMKELMPEDKAFYEKLASDLITPEPGENPTCTICNMPVCPVCLDKDDTPYKCFNCGSGFHDCCAANYSAMKNIGFIHIFRCPTCETLLKLDEDFVNEAVQDKEQLKVLYEDVETIEKEREELPEAPVTPAPEDLTPIPAGADYMEEEQKDLIVIPNIEGEDLQEIPLAEAISSETEKEALFKPTIPEETIATPSPPTKVIRPQGFFGPTIEVPQEPEKQEKAEKPDAMEMTQEPVEETQYWSPSEAGAEVGVESEPKITSITQLRPPKKKPQLRFCKICGAPIKGRQKICLACGAPV